MRDSDRPYLLMVHGFSQNRKLFCRQKADFAAEYEIFTPELKGHGENPNEDEPFGIAEYAMEILAQIDAQGIEQVHYWGSHTGAAVGLLLATYYPHRIASLILEAPVIPGSTMPKVEAELALTKEIAKHSGVNKAMERWFDHAPWFEEIRRNPAECRAEEHRQMILEFRGKPLLARGLKTPQQANVLERLAELRQPCLIYNGTRDVDEFLSCAALLKARVPLSQQLLFEGLGGFPSWESPTRVDEAVREFLGRKNESMCHG